MIVLKPADECRFDAVALGEVMLRLDPGEHRIRSARSFQAYEGGGEYNVVRGLANVFGLRSGIVTALADNEIGRLIENLIRSGGVDTSYLHWQEYDGIGRRARNGLNFTERGFGPRQPIGVSDRGHSAASQLTAHGVDWEALFGRDGVRWFHTGGIQAGLSRVSAQAALAAVRSAREHGTAVSYDLNFRPSLWRETGGATAARQVNAQIAEHVDVLVGSVGHLAASLTDDVVDPPESAGLDGFAEIAERLGEQFPHVTVIAGTRRTVRSATRQAWGAMVWSRGAAPDEVAFGELEIWDRVGAGDSFASGLVYGLLEGRAPAEALRIAVAHGALAMTTPGDSSLATKQEVLALAEGGEARFDR